MNNKHPDFDSHFPVKINTPFGTISTKVSPLFVDSIPFDEDIEKVRQQYCANSGRPLAIVPHQIVADLITVHGRKTTIKILQMQQKKYSYEWLWLNNEGLDSLSTHRPKEYFVYACSKLLQNLTLHSELMRLGEAATAWHNLQNIDESIIIPINELIRRLLANYKQKAVNRQLVKLDDKHVNVITQSVNNLIKFQLKLTDTIQLFVIEAKKQALLERGMSAFRMQKMITSLSQLEMTIGRELNDFDFIDGKASDIIHARSGTIYRKSHIKRDLQTQSQILTAEPKGGFSRKPVVKKSSSFKLKLKLGDK